MDGGVLDLEAVDGAVVHLDLEELGLLLAAVSALAVPPALTLAGDETARGAGDGDLLAADGDEGALPLLVAEGGGALESDLGAVFQAGEVEGLAGGDLDVVEHDVGAGGLLGHGRLGVGEGARGAGVELGGGGGGQGAEARDHGKEAHRFGGGWDVVNTRINFKLCTESPCFLKERLRLV